MMNADSASTHKLKAALILAKLKLPLQADLISHARIALDDRAQTACVFPSGRILLSPAFIQDMTANEVAFIIAHEIFHLYYKTKERSETFADHQMANVAHDLIINGELARIFGFPRPPGGGLHWNDYCNSVDFLYGEDILNQPWKDISDYSFEDLVALLSAFKKNVHRLPPQTLDALVDEEFFPDHLKDGFSSSVNNETDDESGKCDALTEGAWNALDALFSDKTDEQDTNPPQAEDAEESPKTPPEEEDEAQQRWLGSLFSGDVKNTEDEMTMFPNESLLGIAMAEQETKDLIRTAAAKSKNVAQGKELIRQIQDIEHNSDDNGDGLGGNGNGFAGSWEVKILRGKYNTPWELALQAWIDESAPPTRSWTRASRRGAERTDVVLPGRNYIVEDWILNIVLDVSGSMWDVLPVVLGHIQSFGISSGVRYVRLVESVDDCCIDNIMEISELGQYKMSLAEGSDLCPSMLKLAEDPSVQSVLVLTDGDIYYPPAKDIPYDVVWGLTIPPEFFPADYGIKIALDVRYENED